MKEKKKHWWTKLKEKWQTSDEGTKNCVKSWGIGLLTGGIVGAAAGSLITNHIANNDINEITDFASNECVRAFDQGVIEGAKNPQLLQVMKDLGKY